MKRQIRRISVHQTSKVLAIVYGSIGLLFFVPYGLYTLITGSVEPSEAILYVVTPLPTPFSCTSFW